MHNNMVTVDGTRMGKSLGNYITIKQVLSGEHPRLSQAYTPSAVRFFVLSSHYRSPLDFSDEGLLAAERGMGRLHEAVRRVRERLATAADGPADSEVEAQLAAHRERFVAAMDEDFNTPVAISVLFDASRESNTRVEGGEATRGTLVAYDTFYRELGETVLGLVPDELGGVEAAGLTDDLMRLLLDMRAEFRAKKEWARADALRDQLVELGVALEDGPEGTRWRLDR
jgi:cysteinyl-tRNA synthetase